jgi:hypothetical protein
MKKLFVLVAALLLVGVIASAESDVTFSGEVETRWMQDYTNKDFTQSPVVEVKIDAVVDDVSSLYIELEEGANGIGFLDTDGDPAHAFDKAHFTIDLGAAFGLPVGLTLRNGWDEYDLFDAVKVTVGEYEDIIGSDWQQYGNEVNVEVNENVAIRALWAHPFDIKGYSIGVAVTYDPVYVEVGYVEIGSAEVDEDIAQGDIEAGAEFAMEVADGINLSAAAAVDFDLNEGDITDPNYDESYWALGAAVAVEYNEMVTLGIAFRGEQESTANSMQVDVSAAPLEDVEVFLIAGLSLDDDAVYGAGSETLDSMEGSVKFMLGASTWYVGLQWIADGGTGIASEKGDFGPEATDSTSAFVRGELKY